MKLVKWGFVASMGLFLAGCSGTFSGSNNAYLKDGGSTAKTQNTSTVKLKQEKQYLPSDDALVSPHYQAPSMAPPGQNLSANSRVMLTGPQNTALAIKASVPSVWTHVATALKRTPYSIMDKDETLHSYFIVDKVRTGGSIKRESPIYQLTLSTAHGVTELHLLDAKNADVDPVVANRIMRAIQRQYI